MVDIENSVQHPLPETIGSREAGPYMFAYFGQNARAAGGQASAHSGCVPVESRKQVTTPPPNPTKRLIAHQDCTHNTTKTKGRRRREALHMSGIMNGDGPLRQCLWAPLEDAFEEPCFTNDNEDEEPERAVGYPTGTGWTPNSRKAPSFRQTPNRAEPTSLT